MRTSRLRMGNLQALKLPLFPPLAFVSSVNFLPLQDLTWNPLSVSNFLPRARRYLEAPAGSDRNSGGTAPVGGPRSGRQSLQSCCRGVGSRSSSHSSRAAPGQKTKLPRRSLNGGHNLAELSRAAKMFPPWEEITISPGAKISQRFLKVMSPVDFASSSAEKCDVRKGWISRRKSCISSLVVLSFSSFTESRSAFHRCTSGLKGG